MVGWEERAEALVFDLVQLDDELAQFAERHRTRWMTYRREGDNGLVVSFATRSGPSADEFHFVRG